MPRKPDIKSSAQVVAHKHKDKRANIPTEEPRDFVADDEKAPKKILYPLDPSLDPQLVWKGKDEQDRQPLEVPAVPIHIQEKIRPQVIIENLRETARGGDGPEVERITPCAPSPTNPGGAQRTDAPYLKPERDIKRGFVFKRVPHVTLKSIANHEEIDSIHAEFAPKIEKALAALNKVAKNTWQEWEVPRELTTDSTDDPDKKSSVKSVSSYGGEMLKVYETT